MRPHLDSDERISAFPAAARGSPLVSCTEFLHVIASIYKLKMRSTLNCVSIFALSARLRSSSIFLHVLNYFFIFTNHIIKLFFGLPKQEQKNEKNKT